jgi:transposase
MTLYRPASSLSHRTRTPQASRLTGDGLRAILDAVFYVLKSGCPWRLLPRDFPPWKTVYDWFRRWRIDGSWERLNTELRERLRCRLGRRTRTPERRHRGLTVCPHSLSGPREWEAQSVASTAQRRWREESAICSLTLRRFVKDWCSKPRYTAPRFPTRRWNQASRQTLELDFGHSRCVAERVG